MYIQEDFGLLLTINANIMNPDQTAPKGAVWSGSILFSIIGFQDETTIWIIVMNGGISKMKNQIHVTRIP